LIGSHPAIEEDVAEVLLSLLPLLIEDLVEVVCLAQLHLAFRWWPALSYVSSAESMPQPDLPKVPMY